MHRMILAASLVVFAAACFVQAADDTPKAAATQKMLKKKVTLDFKDEFVKDIIEEIQDQVKGIKIQVDTKGGVSRNKRMSIKCKDKPLDEALNDMLAKDGLVYIVISDTKNAYDGSVFIKMK